DRGGAVVEHHEVRPVLDPEGLVEICEFDQVVSVPADKGGLMGILADKLQKLACRVLAVFELELLLVDEEDYVVLGGGLRLHRWLRWKGMAAFHDDQPARGH